MGHVAKFKHGNRTLDIASGRYAVDEGIAPPSALMSINYASGTSANRLGGSSRVSDRAENRTWTFNLHIRGDSMAEIRRAVDDLSSLLAWAGDDDNPLTFSWNESDVVPAPIWGQDGTLVYEVVDGRVDLPYGNNYYSLAALNKQGLPYCTVTLTVKPYALGLPQIAAQAKGHISHEFVGSQDWRDRGITVPQNAPNLFPNPIFGHATFSTSWSASQCVGEENKDPRFIAFGVRSVRLRGVGASAIYASFFATTASTYTVSFRAIRPDGGAVNSLTCRVLFNGSGVSSTYTSLGGGWYLVSASGTGSAVASNYGVNVVQNAEVYVDGFQCENRGFPTALAYGDLYGCAWSGTAHNSSTTRTAGYIRVPLSAENFSPGNITIRSVVTLPVTATLANNIVIAYEPSSNLSCYYNSALGRWAIADGTTTITSSPYALSANTPYVVHAVWEYNRIELFVNSVSVASGVTYTVPTTMAYIYIGTDGSGTLQHHQIISDFVIFGDGLNSTQVSSDYANILPLVSDGQRVTCIPYLWTKGGDSTINVYDDNTYDNWGVYQGVPGSAPADVEYLISGNGGSTAIVGLWDTREFISPGRILYQDQGGTVDANSSGGSYLRTTPPAATETDINTSTVLWTSDHNLYRFVEDREWFALVRTRIASGTGKLRQRLKLSGSNYVTGRQSVAAPVTYFRQVMVPPVHFPRLATSEFLFPNLGHYLTAKNSGAVNSDIDFYCLFPKKHVRFVAGTTVLRDKYWSTEYEFPAASIYESSGVNSQDLNLIPDTNNVILVATDGGMFVGTDSGQESLVFARARITPRYSLV